MIVLLLFSFISGIVTVLSPCILPILPLLLSAGVGRGKYRPYGIIIGLIISFTFFTLALTALVHITGISPNMLRYISIGLIIFFGLTMIFPQFEKLFNRVTSPLARLGHQLESNAQTGTGFISGFILGMALGLIWSPCAGPILAAVTTLVATGSVTWGAILVTVAYSAGSALPMFFIIYGGSKISLSIGALAPYTELIRKLFGVLMILGALAILFHFDIVLQQVAVRYFPTIAIEDNHIVQKELELLKEKSAMNNNYSPAPMIGYYAPDFVGIDHWINSSPLTIAALAGKVVLVDFWTYSCINCVRTLPYLKKWYDEYKDKGLVIVGVHAPEFEFEKNLANVKDAVKRFEIKYPVALDNEYSTWRNYHNNYWPAHYLIDKAGIIRDIHFGEGEYIKTENMIRTLLGLSPLMQQEERGAVSQQTPEIYLGFARAQNYTSELTLEHEKIMNYDYHGTLSADRVGLKGSWFVAPQYIMAKSNTSVLNLNFIARHVYLVLSAEKQSYITVLLDNKPVPPDYYTKDMNSAGQIVVKEARMYEILDLKNGSGRHLLTLQIPENVSLYSFTFGGDTK